jgi:HNH endonuclease
MADEETNREIITRKEAIELGIKYYFTGNPCKHGHVAKRYIGNNGCIVCTLHRSRLHKLTYIPKPRDVKKRREQEREIYHANIERSRIRARKKYEKNAEKIREKRRKYHYNTYIDEKVRKKAQERTRKWAHDNPERATLNAKVSKHKRRALERNAEGSFTSDDMSAIYKAQKGRCAYFSCCGTRLGKKYHADHIVSLSRGGTNDRCNLQLTCGPCNLEKAAKDPIDYARSKGKLI